jgi:hypothetical protein
MASDLMAVAVCAIFARSGYFELFVDVPRAQTARWLRPRGDAEKRVFDNAAGGDCQHKRAAASRREAARPGSRSG